MPPASTFEQIGWSRVIIWRCLELAVDVPGCFASRFLLEPHDAEVRTDGGTALFARGPNADRADHGRYEDRREANYFSRRRDRRG